MSIQKKAGFVKKMTVLTRYVFVSGRAVGPGPLGIENHILKLSSIQWVGRDLEVFYLMGH